MSKKVGVLFSSGLDSTYLVWKNLKEGNIVTPVYLEITNNVNKVIMEKNRVELLVKEFRKDTELTGKINNVEYTIDVGVRSCADKLFFHQIPIWMLGILFIQGLDIDEIQIGYVANDDAIPYLNDIKKIYKSYQSITEKLLPLTFPLMKMKKWQMVRELPQRYKDLMFTCENPRIIESTKEDTIIQYEPCCNCVPCKSIIASDYYETGNFPEIYRENILKDKIHQINRRGFKVVDSEGNDYWEQYSKAVEPMIEKNGDKISVSVDGCGIEEKQIKNAYIKEGGEQYY